MSHDPGLLLRGAGGEAHVYQVHLRVTLQPVTHAHRTKDYTGHSLVLYTDNGDHALLVQTVKLQPCQMEEVTFVVRTVPDAPRLLLARWYAHASDEADHARALEMVASGGATPGHPIPLIDIERKTQGTVEITGWPARADKSEPVYKAAPLLAQIVNQTTQAYKKLRNPVKPNDRFVDVQVHLGTVVRSMPLLFFALLARHMQATPQQSTAYFEHALAAATALSADPSDKEQLLAEMVALPALAWAYRPDKTRSREEIDQWSSLWSYPASATVAFDCEDGTIALMQLVMVLQNVTLTEQATPALREMQTMAKRYVPWLAVNELLSSSGSAKDGTGGGDGYCLHCCLLLLPREGVKASPISIESTARCSGPWKDWTLRELAADRVVYDRARSMASDLRGPDREAMHMRSPVSVVHARKMYGRLIALVSCAGDRARHVLMDGVDTGTFMLDGGDVSKGVQAVDCPVADLERACARALQLTPAPRFPAPPPVRERRLPAVGMDASVLLPAFAKASAKCRAEVRVTDQLSLFVHRS